MVDQAATDALRTRLREERGQKEIFVRGPSIDQLRETCLADTGLAAPQPPQFRTARPEPVAG